MRRSVRSANPPLHSSPRLSARAFIYEIKNPEIIFITGVRARQRADVRRGVAGGGRVECDARESPRGHVRECDGPAI